MNLESLYEMAATYGVRTIGVFVLLLLAWLVAGWASGLVMKSCERSKIDLTIAKFMAKLARYTILILAVLACLGVFGVQTTSFAAVIGAAGIAIGLALQGSLSNFAAGVMLLIFRPYKVGDVVNVGGTQGKVDEIELFTTTLDTPDNRRLILPNSVIFGAVIENVTHHPQRRVDVAVGVEYSADVDGTRRVLEEAVSAVSDVLADPAPQVYLVELGASSVDWVVRAWCETANYWGVREALTRQVKVALDTAGIGIPYPQMDVHVDGPALAPTNSP